VGLISTRISKRTPGCQGQKFAFGPLHESWIDSNRRAALLAEVKRETGDLLEGLEKMIHGREEQQRSDFDKDTRVVEV